MGYSLLGIFSAGILSFATPCVLPIIPIYLSILLGSSLDELKEGPKKLRLQLLLNTGLFIVGFLIVFVLLGLSSTALGNVLAEYRGQLMIIGGLLIFLFGLVFLGNLKFAFLEGEKRLESKRFMTRYSTLNAVILGFLFALGWTPCIGPVLGSVMTYTASQTSDPFKGALYLTVYGLGLGTPLIILSLLGETAKRIVRKVSRWLPTLQKITGVLLLYVGVAMMLGPISVPSGGTLKPEMVADDSSDASVIHVPSERPLLVEFYSDKCNVCNQMKPVISLIEKDCAGKNVEIIKVNVALAKNRSLAEKYRIHGVPTFIFLDKNGNENARLIGFQTQNTMRQALSSLTGGECQGVGLLPEDYFKIPNGTQCNGDSC